MAPSFVRHLTDRISSEDPGTLIRSEDVDIRFALRELTVPPGRVIPPHRHLREDEAWYVLEGVVTFRLGDEIVEASSGAVVLARQGDMHAFANHGLATARMLELFSPGGMERYFLERARRAARSAGGDYAGLTPEEQQALAATFHMEFVDEETESV